MTPWGYNATWTIERVFPGQNSTVLPLLLLLKHEIRSFVKEKIKATATYSRSPFFSFSLTLIRLFYPLFFTLMGYFISVSQSTPLPCTLAISFTHRPSLAQALRFISAIAYVFVRVYIHIYVYKYILHTYTADRHFAMRIFHLELISARQTEEKLAHTKIYKANFFSLLS